MFQAYYKKIDSSSDRWETFEAAQTITFSNDFFVGIAVTSHDRGRTEELKGTGFFIRHAGPSLVSCQTFLNPFLL